LVCVQVPYTPEEEYDGKQRRRWEHSPHDDNTTNCMMTPSTDINR
jgi:hypothetical protein